jgi:hypothetical protein
LWNLERVKALGGHFEEPGAGDFVKEGEIEDLHPRLGIA